MAYARKSVLPTGDGTMSTARAAEASGRLAAMVSEVRFFPFVTSSPWFLRPVPFVVPQRSGRCRPRAVPGGFGGGPPSPGEPGPGQPGPRAEAPSHSLTGGQVAST
ncbi:hypothetical protein TPA0909_51940 [Streptomyces albus]|nr:hypothetical protein TPA0909_51940 [Streptomyces albus]